MAELVEALRSIPQKRWAKSPEVARAFLEDKRVARIVDSVLKRWGQTEKLQRDDLMQELMVLMYAKLLAKVNDVEGVYSLVYASVENLVRTERGREHWLHYSIDEKFQNSEQSESSDDHTDRLLERQDRATEMPDMLAQVATDKARARFNSKLHAIGWPMGVDREYKRLGRPTLEQAASAA